MNIDQIHRMQSDFDSLAQALPDDGSIEFWFARDIQLPLGYARWENFTTAIQRAIEFCETTGYKSEHHFRGVTKMVSLGSGAERRVDDFIKTATIRNFRIVAVLSHAIPASAEPRKETVKSARP